MSETLITWICYSSKLNSTIRLSNPGINVGLYFRERLANILLLIWGCNKMWRCWIQTRTTWLKFSFDYWERWQKDKSLFQLLVSKNTINKTSNTRRYPLTTTFAWEQQTLNHLLFLSWTNFRLLFWKWIKPPQEISTWIVPMYCNKPFASFLGSFGPPVLQKYCRLSLYYIVLRNTHFFTL